MSLLAFRYCRCLCFCVSLCDNVCVCVCVFVLITCLPALENLDRNVFFFGVGVGVFHCVRFPTRMNTHSLPLYRRRVCVILQRLITHLKGWEHSPVRWMHLITILYCNQRYFQMGWPWTFQIRLPQFVAIMMRRHMIDRYRLRSVVPKGVFLVRMKFYENFFLHYGNTWLWCYL